MVEYSKVNVKLLYSQLSELKCAAKNQADAALRMSIKILNGNNLRLELLLTKRQKK